MNLVTSDSLLNELEPLTHSQRVRRIIRLADPTASTTEAPRVTEALAGMARGGPYAKRLALYGYLGAASGTPIAAAVDDASRGVRRLAVRLASVACGDAELAEMLRAGQGDRRLALVRGLLRQRRPGPVNAFLNATEAPARRQWLALLPYGSPDFVRRHAEAIVAAGDANTWRRLARRHAAFCADLLCREVDVAQELDARLRGLAVGLLAELAGRVPDAALALAESLARLLPAGQIPLQPLLGRRPREVARLVLAADQVDSLSFGRIAHRLDAPTRLALLERHPQAAGEATYWLRRLDADQRRAAYAVCGRSWRGHEGLLPVALMTLLPEDLRHAEAQRHLELPVLATRPAQRLAYAAFLPWAEARAAVGPFLRDPDADLRAAALAAITCAARFDAGRLEELLPVLLERQHEQDPVRQAMIGALADLPPGRWKTQHLENLGRLIRHALDAGDVSHLTAGAAERLVVGLVPFHADWAAGWLATLARERGVLLFSGVRDRLRDDHVQRLAPALTPVLKSWQTREREAQIVNVASNLGPRLRAFDALADLLEELARRAAADWVAERAVSLLAEHFRERFNRLVPALLAHDPTWATRPVVYNHLHRRRQDLLGPYLGRHAYKGRFGTGQTRFVMPLTEGFERWTPSQQATFAQTLVEMTRDSDRDAPGVAFAVRQLAALPDVEPTRLLELASLAETRPAVREAALRALGRLDGGGGVPALLEALADERARIAIYALRKAVLEMPPARAMGVLRGAPASRVTVAKEVVRLVGELATDEALAYLLDVDGQELHRDVRSALLRALWSFLDRAEAWAVIDRAAAGGDAAQAEAVARIPADGLGRDGRLRLAELLGGLLTHREPTVRVNVLRRLDQLPLEDPQRRLLPGLLAALESRLPDEAAAAAAAAFATYAGRQAELIGRATVRLLRQRRSLYTLVEALCARIAYDLPRLRPTARAVLGALAADPLTITLRVRLAVLALPPAEWVPLLSRAAEAGELHADALAAATRAMESVAMFQGPAALEAMEMALASQADERLRRLALAALVVANDGLRGWSDAHLARLATYRDDPSPLVAAAAQFAFPRGIAEAGDQKATRR